MGSRPELRLDDVWEAYVAELPGWPMTEEELARELAEPVEERSSRAESVARANRVLARAKRREGGSGTVKALPKHPSLFGSHGCGKTVTAVSLVSRRRLMSCVEVVREAYTRVHQGYSIDKLIADPDQNVLFVRECWRLGMQASQAEINWTLLAARKNGLIGSVVGVERYAVRREVMDQYLFASEIALRHLQDAAYYNQQVDLSLDQILCDPKLACEFEAIARRIAPGFASLDYRWAAFNLRKSQQRSVSTSTVRDVSFDAMGRTSDLRPSRLPKEPGFFWFRCDGADVYIGHAENLRAHIDRWFQVQDAGPRVVPAWLREGNYSGMEMAIAPCPSLSASKREPIKTAYVCTHEPILNLVGRAESAA